MSKSTLTASLKGCPKGLTSHRASCVGLAACRDWVENTGAFNGRGTDASGKPVEEHERWTDTWVKMPNGE